MVFETILLSLALLFNNGNLPTPAFDDLSVKENISSLNYDFYDIDYVYSLENGEPYLLIYNETQSSIIYDLTTNEIYGISNQISDPFLNEKDILKLFYIDEEIQFACCDGEFLWSPGNYSNKISIYTENNLRLDPLGNDIFYENYSPVSQHHLVNMANTFTIIENYEYFLKMGYRHSLNNDKTCSLIAIEIILSYYDIFYDDRFIPERFDKVSTKSINSTSWKDWDYSPGTGFHYIYNNSYVEVDSGFKEYLLEMSSDINPFITLLGSSPTNQRNTLERYLTNLDFLNDSFNIYWSSNNSANPFIAKELIKSVINSGYPLLGSGANHCFVILGYSAEELFVSSGWGTVGLIPWDIVLEDLSYYPPSFISYCPDVPHNHSNNYFSELTNNFICTCGYYKGVNINIDEFIHNSSSTISFVNGFHFNYKTSNIIPNVEGVSGFLLRTNSEFLIEETNPIGAISLKFSHTSIQNVIPRLIIQLFDENNILTQNINLYDLYPPQNNNIKTWFSFNLDNNVKYIKIYKNNETGLGNIRVLNMSIC